MSASRRRCPLEVWLGGLWIVALAVRVIYLAEIASSPLWLVVMGDARSYDTWARQLAAGDWFGSDVFYQAPLYPYFLGAVYTFIGDEPLVVRVVQSLLGATACVLLAIAGTRLVTQRVGLTAGFLLAFYPPAIFFDGLIQKTTLTSFLLCALLAITAGLVRWPRSLARWVLAGVTTGLLSLVRENALVLVLLAPVWIAVAFRQAGSRRFAWTGAFLVGTALILMPVAARNGFVGGEWHLTTSQFGPNFYIGNGAEADGFYFPLLPERGDPLFERTDAISLAQQDEQRSLTPREVSRYWTRRAIADIAADPVGWIGLLFRKLWITYGAMEIIDTEDQYTYAEYSTLLSSLMSVWHMGVLVPLAVFGAAMLLPRRAWRLRLAWPALVIVGYTASAILFFILGRYRFPLVPPLLLFAAAGIWEAVRIARKSWINPTHRRRAAVVSLPSQAKPRKPVVLLRLSFALLLAAIASVPANIFPYPIAYAQTVTRENLGEHLYHAGFPVEMAVSEYERAVALTPINAVLRANYAQVLWDVGDREAAREQLELAVRDAPDDAVTLVELGLMLRELDEIDAASERLRAAVAAAPERPEPPYHLAVTLLRGSDQVSAEAAAKAIDRGLALPDDEESDVGDELDRAKALRTEAAKLLRASLAIEDSEAAHAALGRALAALGQADDAAEEYAAAADRAPPGSQRQARLLHLQRRIAGTPKARRSASLLRRR